MTKITYFQSVTKFSYCGDHKRTDITSRTFSGAKLLVNLKSIHLTTYVNDRILTSLKVNCPHLEEVKIECRSVGLSTTFESAARMVRGMPRLRNFTFTRNSRDLMDIVTLSPIQQSSSSLLLALAQCCPLLESLNLVKYDDEGLTELVAGCPKLHTLTIQADLHGVSLAGFRALGASRSITTLHMDTYFFAHREEGALNAMADGGLPISFLELHNSAWYDPEAASFVNGISSVVRFASTLEHLTIRDLPDITDEHLEILSQCHKLRSIEIFNAQADDSMDVRYGKVTGAFLIPMSIGCPSLEMVTVSEEGSYEPLDPTEAINFQPFFQHCPKLKSIDVDIRTDDDIKALAIHCPLVESIKLGSSHGTISQEHSEISDESLVAIAQNLKYLTHLWLNHTQCTDVGLLALAQGKCHLKEIHIHNGSWRFGYPELITIGGIKKFDAIMQERTNNYAGFQQIFYS